MRRYLLLLAVATVGALAFSPAASAQAGHFVGTPTCTDEGTFLVCTGKVAGLGGTTFRIDVSASGVADVTCTNPGGQVAPGQSFSFEGAGSTGDQLTPRNGQFRFSLTSDDPEPLPATPTCPNDQWTPNIVDVTFTDATLTLFEDGVQSDQVVVPVT